MKNRRTRGSRLRPTSCRTAHASPRYTPTPYSRGSSLNPDVGNENIMKTITTWILWGLSIASTLALSMVAFFERYGVEKYNAHLFRADFPTHNIFFHYTIPLFVIVYLLIIAFLIPRFRSIRPDLLAINTAIIFICLLSIVFSYFLTMTQLLPVAP